MIFEIYIILDIMIVGDVNSGISLRRVNVLLCNILHLNTCFLATFFAVYILCIVTMTPVCPSHINIIFIKFRNLFEYFGSEKESFNKLIIKEILFKHVQ